MNKNILDICHRTSFSNRNVSTTVSVSFFELQVTLTNPTSLTLLEEQVSNSGHNRIGFLTLSWHMKKETESFSGKL